MTGKLSSMQSLGFVLIGSSFCFCPAVTADDGKMFQEPVTVVGRALDIDGKPIAGAEIFLASVRYQQRLLDQTTTNEKGEYNFDAVPMPVNQPERGMARGVFEVFGMAKGYGFAWRGQKWFYPDGTPDYGGRIEGEVEKKRFAGDEAIQQDLTFDKPAPLSGQVVDETGKPIPNTSIVLFNAEPVPESGYDKSRDFFVVGEQDFTALYLSRVIPGEMRQRFTDENGHFSFDNAPNNAGFRIFVKPPGFAKRGLFASTATKDKIRFKDRKIEFDGMKLVFHTVRRCPISVVYADTGKPAKNVRVELSSKAASQSSTTDDKGTAELRLPPGEYRAHYLTEFGTPYISRYSREAILSHTIPAGEDEPVLQIRLEPAAIVDIEVVDAHIGRPIEGVDIWVRGGDYQHEYSWRSWRPPNISMVDRPRTNDQGKMRVFLKPGTYSIGAGNSHTPPKYSANGSGVKKTVKAGETVTVKLKMKRLLVRE